RLFGREFILPAESETDALCQALQEYEKGVAQVFADYLEEHFAADASFLQLLRGEWSEAEESFHAGVAYGSSLFIMLDGLTPRQHRRVLETVAKGVWQFDVGLQHWPLPGTLPKLTEHERSDRMRSSFLHDGKRCWRKPFLLGVSSAVKDLLKALPA